MMFDILDLVMLPALALLCAATSFEDAREGLIRNKWIVMGLLWGAAAYGFLSISRIFSPELTLPALSNTLFNGSWPRLQAMTALNSASALLCGFLIFHIGYWSAGDAKLFFAVSLLLPLKYYFRHFLPVFPAFCLFLNVITVSAVYVWSEAILGIFKFARNNPEKNILREVIDSSAVKFRGGLDLFLAALVLFTAIMCLNSFFRLSGKATVPVNMLAMLALLFIGGSVERVLERRAVRLCVYAAAALFFGAVLSSSLRLQAVRMGVFMACMFTLIFLMTGIIPELSSKYGTHKKEMPFALWLSLGTILTAVIKGSLLYLLVL